MSGWPTTPACRAPAATSASPACARCGCSSCARTLSAARLRAWLGWQAERGQSRPAVDQARAAIVTLTQLLVEAGWLDDYIGATVANVRAPKAASGRRPGRWLSTDEINRLIAAGSMTGNSRNQRLRNRVVLTMLCTLALRRDELARARFGDFSMQNGRPVLRVQGKGNSVAVLDVPHALLAALADWRQALAEVETLNPQAPLVRRLWKGGRIEQRRTVNGRHLEHCGPGFGAGRPGPRGAARSAALGGRRSAGSRRHGRRHKTGCCDTATSP